MRIWPTFILLRLYVDIGGWLQIWLDGNRAPKCTFAQCGVVLESALVAPVHIFIEHAVDGVVHAGEMTA